MRPALTFSTRHTPHLMRRARNSPTRIPSATYLQGYAYDRGGVAYVRCRDIHRSLNVRWPADDAGRKAIQAALDDWLGSLERGTVATVRTVDQLMAAWLDGPGAHLSRHVLRHMSEAYRMLPEGAGLRVEGLVAACGAIRKSGLAPATVQKRLKSLKRLFAWGVEMGMLERNPVAMIGIPVPPKRRDRALFSASDVEALCELFAARDTHPRVGARPGYRAARFGLLWRWLYLTAMRIGEVEKLRWEDVAPDGIRVHGKGDRDRWFPLEPFPEVRTLLTELRAETGGDVYVFPWRQTNSVGKALREAMKELHERHPDGGWTARRTVHTFRASAERRWREELGLSVELISDLAGHSVTVQLQHYRGDRPAADLAAAVARELRGGGGAGNTG